MKNTFYTFFLYLALVLLLAGCQEDAPKPACLQVEVVGEDCETGWYILKVENNADEQQDNNYLGQLQSGYVTTDNLPQEYRIAGLRLEAALEVNGEDGPRCVAIYVMHPAVKVTRVCSAPPAGD